MVERLSAYAIEGIVGRGGMGTVYRARHLPTGARRAVKILATTSDAEAIARFRREAEALARLGPDVAVAIHEAGVAEDGRLFYAMDLMAGSLRDGIRARGRLPWAEAATLAARVARALERCHLRAIVHRDLKPENVLLDEEGRLRLADFGLARDLAGEALTRTGAGMMGTPAYMAPEQLVGEHGDAPSDVFALGLVLGELLTGEVPGRGQGWIQLHAERSSPPPPLDPALGVPPLLGRLRAGALAPAPGDRPTARELAEGLEACARGAAVVASGAFGRSTPPAVVRVLPLALALLGLGALGVGALAVARHRSDPSPSPGLVSTSSPAPVRVLDAERQRVRAVLAGTSPVTSSDVTPLELAALADSGAAEDLTKIATREVLYAEDDAGPIARAHPTSRALQALAAYAALAEGRGDRRATVASLSSATGPLGHLGRALTEVDQIAADIASAHRESMGNKGRRDELKDGPDVLLAKDKFKAARPVIARLPERVQEAALAPFTALARQLAFRAFEKGAVEAQEDRVDDALHQEMLDGALCDELGPRSRPPRLFLAIEVSYGEPASRKPQFGGDDYARLLDEASARIATSDRLLAASALIRAVRLRGIARSMDSLAVEAEDSRRVLELLSEPFTSKPDQEWALYIRHDLHAELAHKHLLRYSFGAGPEFAREALEEARAAVACTSQRGAASQSRSVEDVEHLVAALLENGEPVSPEMGERIPENRPLRPELERRRGDKQAAARVAKLASVAADACGDDWQRRGGFHAVATLAAIDAGDLDFAERQLNLLNEAEAPGERLGEHYAPPLRDLSIPSVVERLKQARGH